MKEIENVQRKMFGMTTQEIKDMVEENLKSNRDTRMMIMSILSDIQETIDNDFDPERIRKDLNLAKYLVDTTLKGVSA